MKFYSVSKDEYDKALSNAANIGKDMVLSVLATDGKIPQEDLERLQRTYAVIVVQKGMLGHIVDNFLFHGENKDESLYKLVRLLP